MPILSRDPPSVVSPPAAGPRSSIFVPVLPFGQELVLRVLVLLWVVASAWFWLWWTAAERGSWSVVRIGVTAALAWVFAMSAYFLFFACRMTRPDPALAVPDLRVAMVVTKAPSEDWPIVRTTLEAMLAQRFPKPYDVWLADESPTVEVVEWCRANGVELSSREGIEEYQQPTWPRRRRCKEGNLAYFYDTYGYERYDVVAQLDADHVPAPGYLEEMVRPFADPGIGYVAAPSICDSNEEAGWTVKGRLFREATLHGVLQAGCNNGWAPVCIGSHYAVRTQALQQVGGLGPELAEDYTTTLWLQAGGWDGAFAIDAEAHGEGPATTQEMLTQELQWSRSLMTILLQWAPRKLGQVPRKARLRLAFALLYYPIQSFLFAAGSTLPVLGLVLDRGWSNVSLAGFHVRMWLCALPLILVVAHLKRCGVLRPRDAKLTSLSAGVFQLVRWPWSAWGCVQGLLDARRRTPRPIKVTPKGTRSRNRLLPSHVNPLIFLAWAPAMAVVFATEPRRTPGLVIIATLVTAMYLAAAIFVVVSHNDLRSWDGAKGPAINVAAAVVLIGGALAWRFVTHGFP